MRVGARRRRLELGVILLSLFVLALNTPYLDPRALPIHDTFYNFVVFYVFYNEFFFHGELAHWLPYGAFGLPADLEQVIALTPVGYLVGAVGALARVTDAALLFKLSLIGEQLVFVIGTYVLSRRLFPSRATALALGVAAAGTLVWYAQLWFELRFFYMLPLILLGAVNFLDRRGSEWLWLAGIASVVWAMGNVPYFVPLWALVLLACLAAAALRDPVPWSRLFARNGASLLLVVVFVFGATAYAYLAFHGLDFVVMREPGRDPTTRGVDLDTFRTWGGKADLATVARSFLLGRPVHLPWGSGADNSAYVGLLPLVGLGVAIATERGRLFLGLCAALVGLVWLSLGGVFATVVYYLPTLSQYRHIGLVYGLVKAVGIVAAGYGIERLWRWPLPLPSSGVLWGVAALLAVASTAVVPALWHSHTLLRLWLYAVAIVLSLALTRSLQAGLVIALALDLAVYQGAAYRAFPKLPPAYAEALDAARVHPLSYQPRRYATPVQAPLSPVMVRAERALRLVDRPGAMTTYWVSYNFAQFDPCRGQHWANMWASGVDELLRIEQQRRRPMDEILSCKAPKLRLVSDATVVESVRAARQALLAPPADDGRVRDVIRVPPDAASGAAATRSERGAAGSVEVTQFSLDELVAEVAVSAPAGAWLVYADAFHPGWRASVDGNDSAIAEANRAFKAVWLPSGDHVVRLWFQHGASYYASYALAAFGVASGFALLVGFGVAAFPREPLA